MDSVPLGLLGASGPSWCHHLLVSAWSPAQRLPQALAAAAVLFVCHQRDPLPMLPPWGHLAAVGVRWLRWPRHW